jgi:hypothetical protein
MVTISKCRWTPERNAIGHTHVRASSEQAWDPMASSSANSCSKTSTVPAANAPNRYDEPTYPAPTLAAFSVMWRRQCSDRAHGEMVASFTTFSVVWRYQCGDRVHGEMVVSRANAGCLQWYDEINDGKG